MRGCQNRGLKEAELRSRVTSHGTQQGAITGKFVSLKCRNDQSRSAIAVVFTSLFTNVSVAWLPNQFHILKRMIVFIVGYFVYLLLFSILVCALKCLSVITIVNITDLTKINKYLFLISLQPWLFISPLLL